MSPSSSTPLPGLSVVIPSRDRADRLAAVIPPLLADPATAEVLVVLDGATDGSVELLDRLAAQDARVRHVWQESAGPAAARRTGLARAAADVVLLLDDDVLPAAGLVTGHARAHAAATGPTAVVGWMPTHVPSPRRAGDFATALYAEEYERMCAEYEADPAAILENLWLGNVSVPRGVGLTAMRATGDLLFHEDKEFGLRLRECGVRGVFDRELRGTHLHVRDLAGFLRVSRREGFARQWLADHDTMAGPLVRPRDVTPLPLRPLLLTARRPAVAETVLRAGAALVRAAGRLRLWPLEAGVGRLLRQVQIEVGMREALVAGS